MDSVPDDASNPPSYSNDRYTDQRLRLDSEVRLLVCVQVRDVSEQLLANVALVRTFQRVLPHVDNKAGLEEGLMTADVALERGDQGVVLRALMDSEMARLREELVARLTVPRRPSCSIEETDIL